MSPNLPSPQNGSFEFELEPLVEQLWQEWQHQIPQQQLRQIICHIAACYQNAPVKQYVPIFVRREAKQILQTGILSADITTKFC